MIIYSRHSLMQPDPPVTCAPVGRKHTTQCTPFQPPLRGRQKESGAGGVPRPRTPSCAWSRNLLLRGPSCSAGTSSLVATTDCLHPGMILGCRPSVVATKDEVPVEQEGPQDGKERPRRASSICRLSLGLRSYCRCTYSLINPTSQ